MKIGMNLFLWTTNLTDDLYPLLRRLKEVGYQGVEVPVARANATNYGELRKVLDALGLACATMFNLGATMNPISSDSASRQRGLDELKWAIDLSRDTLRSEILVGPFFAAYGVFSGQGPTADELARSADIMHKAAEYAGDFPLGIEFLNRFEIYLLNTVGQSVALVDKVGRHNFGILYDTHHAHHEENDLTATILSAGAKINHVHFSESHRGTLGTGLVDWIATAKALKAINYDRWIMVESFAKDIPMLAPAAHVWRDCFASKEEVYEKGIEFVRGLWAT